MYEWPNVELTDYERRHVALYETQSGGPSKGKPGVLKRVYRVGTFCTAPLPDIGQVSPIFRRSLIVSRRSRVFGLEFIGNTWAYFLKIQSAGGELYTAGNVQKLTDGTNPPEGCLVSSMIAGGAYNAESYAQGPLPFNSAAFGEVSQASIDGEYENGALLIDPNIALMPNTPLEFSVVLAPSVQLVLDNPDDFEDVTNQICASLTLAIGVHVWEFPGMYHEAQINPGGDA